MKRYIRTKDEILSNSRPNIEDIDSVLTDQRGWIKKCNVIKQSDTIEELCDGFVIDFKNGSHTFYQDFEDTKLLYNGNQDLFGAIWTSKGLIYVAKMNDKGELELL